MDQQKEWIENEKKTREYIDKMTKDLSETKLKDDICVFRGVNTVDGVIGALNLNVDKGKYKEFLKNPDFAQSLIGYQFRDNAFTSTTVDANISHRSDFGGAAELTILCPKGTQATYFGDALRITDEQELLLQRGTQYTITDAYVNSAGKLHMDLVVTDQTPQEIPPMKKLYETNQKIVEAAKTKTKIDGAELKSAYPNVSTDMIQSIQELRDKDSSMEQYNESEDIVYGLMLSGKVNAYEAAEIASYMQKRDAISQADSYDKEIKRYENSTPDQNFIDQARRDYAGKLDDSQIRKVALMRQEADGYIQRANSSDFFKDRLLNEAKRMQHIEKLYVKELREV